MARAENVVPLPCADDPRAWCALNDGSPSIATPLPEPQIDQVGHHGHPGRHVGEGGGVEHAAHALRLLAGLDQLHLRQDPPRPAGGVELHRQGRAA